MLFVLGIIFIALQSASRIERNRFELIERLLARGERVPPELLRRHNDLPPEEQRRRDLRRGIVLLAWGLGVGIVFYIVSGGQLRAAAWSLIFLFLSAASFLNWYLSDRLEARQERTHGA
jgi:Flp pilus assembly protein TadB